jgi:flagellar basal body-associated protein FliL
MTQPPEGHGGLPGHPEPGPDPEPAPPQPIPPAPVPAPEPPHVAEPWRSDQTTDFSTASGSDDFIDAGPPPAAPGWPPVGAYPGEPGHAPDDSTQLIPAVPSWQQQAPPNQPWHAQHERPGEWRTQPPEHLAYQHSPPPELQPQQEPIWGGGPQHPPYQVPLQPPARRRGTLWVSLALAVTVMLCAGGAVSAYFLLRDADSQGATDPATAVNQFLTAVYTQHNAKAADELVCRQARDEAKLTARIDQIKTYVNAYDSPSFRWEQPAVTGQSKESATVSVQLVMATADEKSAEQQLTFTTIHKTGWLVCDVTG